MEIFLTLISFDLRYRQYYDEGGEGGTLVMHLNIFLYLVLYLPINLILNSRCTVSPRLENEIVFTRSRLVSISRETGSLGNKLIVYFAQTPANAASRADTTTEFF